MKYFISNDKEQSGGIIPHITNQQVNPLDKKEFMNVHAPLYFNLDKKPLKDSSNSYYNYDFDYGENPTSMQIDNNLNIN